MTTLMYSPGVRIKIDTAREGVIDVSNDIVNGQVSLTTGSPGSLSVTLSNFRRKYDGIFTPNDRVTVALKRIRWMQVFSGYLDDVPYFSVYPRNIELTASDSLKRLQYFTWDPGSPAAFALLHGAKETDVAKEVDGGLRNKVHRLLTEVAGWPSENIHIGGLPKQWFDTVTQIQESFADRFAVEDTLGAGPSLAGTVPAGSASRAGVGPYTGALPTPTTGRASWFGGPQGGAYGNMALSGESGVNPKDPWFAAMRFPYQGYVNGRIKAHGTPTETRNAINWWKQQRLVVTAPNTGKSIVVRCADWGPGGVKTADDRIIDLSKQGLAALGIPTDGQVTVRFADPTTPLGPTKTQASVASPRQADAAQGAGGAQAATGASHPAATAALPAGTTSGLRFQAKDRLQPHVAAARQFILMNWPQAKGYGIGGWGQRPNPTDHSTGHALDVMVCTLGKMPNEEQRAFGNSVAMWFLLNPDAFDISYIIWQKKIIKHNGKGQGWTVYGHPTGRTSITLDHYDHVHISFKHSGRTALGAMGNPVTPGSSPSDFLGSVAAAGGVVPGSEGGTTSSLLNTFNWQGQQDAMSSILTGPRLLLNDTYLLPTIDRLTRASMRDFMAAPNGDFMAWFPDYFGFYGQAGRLHIADIELVGDGFTVQWSDRHLVTHQFATGAAVGSTTGLAGIVDDVAQYQTMGIASVEYPEIMRALFNVDPNSPAAKNFFSAEAVLNRFGARVNHEEMGSISGGVAEFWYALKRFQENWSDQFQAQVGLTFMPEAWPGMLMVLDSYRFQAYIKSVTHRFDFSPGSGFTTSVQISSPSSLDGGGLYGLPRGTGPVVSKDSAAKDGG